MPHFIRFRDNDRPFECQAKQCGVLFGISAKVIRSMTRCMIGHSVDKSIQERACVLALSSVWFPYFYVSTDRIPSHIYTFIPFKECFGSPLSCIIITLFRCLSILFPYFRRSCKQTTNQPTISLIDSQNRIFLP